MIEPAIATKKSLLLALFLYLSHSIFYYFLNPRSGAGGDLDLLPSHKLPGLEK